MCCITSNIRLDLMEKIWVLISVGQIMLCNTTILAVILFIFSKSKSQTSYESLTSKF